MKKILIICDVYPPSFAPRMGYLVKYMKEWGYEADIVTRGHDKDISFKSLVGNEKILRVKTITISVKNKADVIKKIISLKRVYRSNVSLLTNRIINELKADDYRLILCSTAHRTFLLNVANRVATKWKKPWIADIRDIYEQNPKKIKISGIKELIIDKIENNFNKFAIKLRNKHLLECNIITTITPWHVEQLKKHNQKVRLIYNGYCPEQFYRRDPSFVNKFTIIYTGLIVSKEYRDPTFLFQATKKLKESGIIDNQFRIQFYTPKGKRNPILETAGYNDISEFIDFYDYVDTSEVPEILAKSSIQLLLTNRYSKDGPKGIMTTKYFEYLAMERPILAVRSDENLLEDSINEANAGVSARTVDEAYDFLLKKWTEWQKKGYTTVSINKTYTKQFSRKLQAKQFVDVFEEITKY